MPFCLIFRLSPALRVTFSPVLTSDSVALFAGSTSPVPSLSAVIFQAPPLFAPLVWAALMVTVCLPVDVSVVEVTVTPPSPLNSTSSPLLTVEVVPLPAAAAPLVVLSCQPNLFNSVARLSALTSFLLSPFLGVLTLPLVTVRLTVLALHQCGQS